MSHFDNSHSISDFIIIIILVMVTYYQSATIKIKAKPFTSKSLGLSEGFDDG